MAMAAAPEALSSPSIDPDEVAKFTAMADEWWDPTGKFRPLHKFNPVRLAFIRDVVTQRLGRDPNARRPFEGLRFLDIGCGGGLVSEPMARLGAHVLGVDAAQANVKTASIHAQNAGLTIDYRHGTAEQILDAQEGPFDVVLNLEVVEHVADPAAFLETCAALVAPGGVMIVATINRTAKAFALAIFGAEYVMRWLPRGTHEYAKLVRPQEVRSPLERQGLSVEGPIGVSFNPLFDRWALSGDSAVNYMMTAQRPTTAAT